LRGRDSTHSDSFLSLLRLLNRIEIRSRRSAARGRAEFIARGRSRGCTAGSREAPTRVPSANGWDRWRSRDPAKLELTSAERAEDEALLQSRQVILRSMNIGRNTRDHEIACYNGQLQSGNVTGSLRDPVDGEGHEPPWPDPDRVSQQNLQLLIFMILGRIQPEGESQWVAAGLWPTSGVSPGARHGA
jgi:hypothetical protein